MKFICSVNKGVVPHLHPEQGKIAKGGNFAAFNSGWESKNLSTEELVEVLSTQAGLCAWHLVDGQRKAKGTGVIQAGLVIVDIDNQADGKDKEGNKIQKQELTPEEHSNLISVKNI